METDAVIFCQSSTGKRLSLTETWNAADEALLPSPPLLASPNSVALQFLPLTNALCRHSTWRFACVRLSGVYQRQQLLIPSQLKLGIIWFDSDEPFQQTCFNNIASFLDSATLATYEALPADWCTAIIYLTGFKLLFQHKPVWKGHFFVLSCSNYT